MIIQEGQSEKNKKTQHKTREIKKRVIFHTIAAIELTSNQTYKWNNYAFLITCAAI